MSSEECKSGMTHKEVTFEEVTVGTNIPSLVKRPTTVSLFMFGAVTWITHRIHFDYNFARSRGLHDVVVHGPLQAGYLIQMITEWLGESGTLRKLSYRHHMPAFPGDVLTCTGVVKDKRAEDGKGCLEVELLIKNQHDERVSSGTATVHVPMKRLA